MSSVNTGPVFILDMITGPSHMLNLQLSDVTKTLNLSKTFRLIKTIQQMCEGPVFTLDMTVCAGIT